jgi:hypothetical protein
VDSGILLIAAAVVGLAVLTLVIVLVFRFAARWLLAEEEDERR